MNKNYLDLADLALTYWLKIGKIDDAIVMTRYGTRIDPASSASTALRLLAVVLYNCITLFHR